MTKQSFINQAESRETSPEIMEAIYEVALSWRPADVYNVACSIWIQPKEGELRKIMERVLEHGGKASDYCWGAAGHYWAE